MGRLATKCVLFFYMLLHNFYKKKSPLSSTRLLTKVSSSSFGMRLCPLNLKEVYSSDTDALLRLMRWWEGKLCPDSELCFIPCNDFKLTCSTFFFVLYSDMQDPQNVLTIISTKTLIWYNPMFVLYFVYQVLISKN